ncbi:serine/threonine protein kinase, partial [Streptomyces sp. T-3]|nr:serine/threonine protein kinase [Streptomyces sp. T-3]
GGNGGSGGSNGSGDSPGSTDGGDSQGTGGDGGGDDGGKNGGGDGGTTTPPPQSVKVTVSGASTDYTGTCPPATGEAPNFTASITVGRVPVTVEYRWVTAHGKPSDPDWKTLDFAAGGGKTQQVNHTETAYEANGTIENEMGVEVREPLAATSNSVAYTVACEEEPPTDGGSYTPDVNVDVTPAAPQAVLTRRR